jgi:hypothetical protein
MVMDAQDVQAHTSASRPSRHWARRFGVTAAGIGGLLLALVLAYSAATAPVTRPGRSPLTGFDPATAGSLEQRAWAAYYLRQWPTLFDLLLRLTRGQFGLPLPGAAYASYLGTQAQAVWARQGAQDGLAEAYMRRFYAYVREPAGGQYDAATAAVLEVRWWAVHRNRDQYPDRTALAEALAATYAEVYQAPAERMLPAGDARAAAMDLSDQWIREGKRADSPLLDEIATLLTASYQLLADATEHHP